MTSPHIATGKIRPNSTPAQSFEDELDALCALDSLLTLAQSEFSRAGALLAQNRRTPSARDGTQ